MSYSIKKIQYCARSLRNVNVNVPNMPSTSKHHNFFLLMTDECSFRNFHAFLQVISICSTNQIHYEQGNIKAEVKSLHK